MRMRKWLRIAAIAVNVLMVGFWAILGRLLLSENDAGSAESIIYYAFILVPLVTIAALFLPVQQGRSP
jgi:hypothetical protein